MLLVLIAIFTFILLITIGEMDYQPVHVRMRLPILTKNEQRVQMSWKEFRNRMTALVKVDI